MPRPWSAAYRAIQSHSPAWEVYSAWMEASTRMRPSSRPCHFSVSSRWTTQSWFLSGSKGSSNWTPPQETLALMPAFSTSRRRASVCIYMSAMQVTPEAISSARPRAAQQRMARSSHLASTGKMKLWSQSWRSWPSP